MTTQTTAESWQQYKELIWRWYIGEDLGRAEVVERLKNRCGFPVTLNQLAYQLRLWGIKKDLTEAETLHIARQLAERKRPTAVYLSGKQLSKSKVERAIRRHAHPRISSRYMPESARGPSDTGLSPQIVIGSPRCASDSAEMCFESWPGRPCALPWISLNNCLSEQFGKLSITPAEAAMPMTSIFGTSLRGITNGSTDQVAAVLDQRMPEAFHGENERRAHTLTSTRFGLDLESFKLGIFQISNNFLNIGYGGPFETLKLCRALGVDRSDILTALFNLAVREPSIAAVLDRLFRDACEAQETGLVSAMIKENVRYDRGKKHHIRPFPVKSELLNAFGESNRGFRFCIYPTSRNLDRALIEVLLGPIRDPTVQLDNTLKDHLLELAASFDSHRSSLEAVETLLSRGAKITSRALLSAIAAGNEPLVRLMAAEGANLCFEMGIPISMFDERYISPPNNVFSAAVIPCCPHPGARMPPWPSSRTGRSPWPFPRTGGSPCLFRNQRLRKAQARDEQVKENSNALQEHDREAELHALSMYRLILELLEARTAAGGGLSSSDFAASQAGFQDALMSATYLGYNNLIRQIARSSDMNREDKFGWTPLQVAIISQNTDTCRLILELGADPNQKYKPAQFESCKLCHYTAPSRDGFLSGPPGYCCHLGHCRHPSHCCHETTPLAQAIHTRSLGAAEVLLSSRILLSASEFHLALLYGNPRVVKRMLEIGIDQGALYHKSAAGDTPLQSVLKYRATDSKNGKVQKAYLDILEILAGTSMSLCAFPGDLSRAARDGSRPLVVRLLKSLSPNDSDPDGTTALHHAFMRGHSEVVKVLIESGATLPNDGLAYAFRNLSAITILDLLKLAPDLSQYFRQKTAHGRGCLEMAILSKDEAVVKLAFACIPGYESGALCAALALEIPSETMNVQLHWQHENELPTRLQELLKRRVTAGEDELDHTIENTAIGIAAYMKCHFLLTALLRHPHPHQQCFLPRMWKYNRIYGEDDLTLDLDNLRTPWVRTWRYHEFWGEFNDYKGAMRSSPLFMAVKSGDANAIYSMICAGYRPDARTLLSAIAAANMQEDLHDEHELCRQTLICLIEHSSDINVKAGKLDPTPLDFAIRQRNVPLVQLLLEYGADINSGYSGCEQQPWTLKGVNSRTPLQAGIENVEGEDLESLFNLLLANGADIHAPAYLIRGATALQLAAIGGKLRVARRLVKLGADVNAVRALIGGRTALEGAAEHGRLEVVQFLLNVGVSTTGIGKVQYLRALNFAVKEGHDAVADLLREHREWDPEDDALSDELRSSIYNSIDRRLFVHPLEFSLDERTKLRRWALEQGFGVPFDPEVTEAEKREEKMAALDFQVLFGNENADPELSLVAECQDQDSYTQPQYTFP